MPALVQPKEGSHIQPRQDPVQAAMDVPSGPHSAAPQGHIAPDSPLLRAPGGEISPHCAPSPTLSLQRDFLSLSKFFRGFS